MRPLLLEAGCQVRSRVHPLTITTSRCVRCDLSPFPRARKVTVKTDPIFVGRAFEGWVICRVSESVNIRVGVRAVCLCPVLCRGAPCVWRAARRSRVVACARLRPKLSLYLQPAVKRSTRCHTVEEIDLVGTPADS